jgi:Uma2 family endonuclease
MPWILAKGYDRDSVQGGKNMVQAKTRFTTIEEYAALTTSDLPEGRFELVYGEIIEMGAETDQNIKIAIFLITVLVQYIPFYLLRRGTEIQVKSPFVTCREPDLIVLTPEANDAMQADKRSIIRLSMPNPLLVVEVVSPGDENDPNYQRDYLEKPHEYAQRGIPEYWRIDPSQKVVAVLRLEGTAYQVTEFQGSDRVLSPAFPELTLTAEAILNPGQ